MQESRSDVIYTAKGAESTPSMREGVVVGNAREGVVVGDAREGVLAGDARDLWALLGSCPLCAMCLLSDEPHQWLAHFSACVMRSGASVSLETACRRVHRQACARADEATSCRTEC